MKKSNTAATPAHFKVTTVYGFKSSREVVVLGHLLRGDASSGTMARLLLNKTALLGEWPIKEVLDIDFINEQDKTDFIGLVLTCENMDSYNLLQSLRVYGEVLEIK